jgi:hypothetical protein
MLKAITGILLLGTLLTLLLCVAVVYAVYVSPCV